MSNTTEENKPAEEVEGQAPEQTAEQGNTPDTERAGSEQTPEGETPKGDEKPKLSYEELEAELAKVRKEAADRRVQKKALEDKLANAKSPEEVEEILATERAQRASESRQLTVENVALKFGLPSELQEVLKGETREELEAHAKTLSKFAPQDDEQDGNPSGGLNPSTNDGGFDAKAEAQKMRRSRRRGR